MIFKIIVKMRSKKYGYPIVKVTKEALEYYHKNILGNNKKNNNFLLQRKICRAWYLGHTISIVAGVVQKQYKNINIYYDFAKMEIYEIEHITSGIKIMNINSLDKKIINDLYCLIDRGDF